MNPLTNPNIDKHIKLRTRSLEVIYDPLVVVRLQ